MFHQRNMTVKCNIVIRGQDETKEEAVKDIITRQAKLAEEDQWLRELARDKAKNGALGGNKLRTYRLFKKDICFEPYLTSVNNWHKRVLLFKLRAGVAPLRIETGRYEHGKYLPPHQRTCLCCNMGIEDERHIICDCPLYAAQREVLKGVCADYNRRVVDDAARLIGVINTENMDSFFVDVMKSTDYTVINALADYVWDVFDRRTRFLELW